MLNQYIVTLILSFIFMAAYVQGAVSNNTLPVTDLSVTIKANNEHDFLLAADYYQGAKRAGGVMILHDCNSDRSRYSSLAKNIAEQGLHTLSLDFRGYGASVSEAFSRDKIKKNATDIVSYQGEMALLTTYWQADLLAAYQYLRSKVDKSKGIAVVASGCSASYAVALAEKILLNSLVIITPKMTYNDRERYKNLVDIPSYFITSSHHGDSVKVSQELFNWNGSKQSKIQIFKGNRYGYSLLFRKKHLASDIAHWVGLNVNK